MVQIVWCLWGKNKTRDYQFQESISAIIEEWVISWLEVTVNSVAVWGAFIEVVRTWWETFKIPFYSTEVEVIATWINKKIYIEIWQDNIDDWDLNNALDWTWIWSIVVWDTFPAWNYIPLAESNWSWVITDLRVFIDIKKAILNLDWIVWDIRTTGDLYATVLYWDWSNLTWLQAEVTSPSLNIMMWANWVTPWIAYSRVNYEQLVWTTANNIWSVAQPQIAQSFYWQVAISTISLMVATISSPSDNLFIEIQWNNAWIPDWVAIWTSNLINYTALSWVLTEKDFTFASPVTVTEWVIYHIVLKRSWATDAVNYYSVWSAWSSVQIGTMSKNTWSWANASDDIYFKLPLYKLATIWGTNFIWILQTAKNIWEIWKFNTYYDNNQTWLIEWSYYWFNATTWIIQLWGSFKAISTTELYYDISYEPVLNIAVLWDWSDWNVVIPSWTTTLTRDMYYNNLTVQTGWVLNPNWYLIFVRWALKTEWTWKIARNWNAGTNWWLPTWGAWWGALNQWSIWWEVQAWAWWAWSNSSNWESGSAWMSASPWYTTIGGATWWVWWTAWSYVWWNWWIWWISTQWEFYNKYFIPRMVSFFTTVLWYKWPASSGWWGGWCYFSWTWWGGWGGWWNWWCIIISVYSTIWTINIESKWWNWGNWYPWNNRWGGGWGGWNWGVVLFFYTASKWTPTISATLTLWNWWTWALHWWTAWWNWNSWILYSIPTIW